MTGRIGIRLGYCAVALAATLAAFLVTSAQAAFQEVKFLASDAAQNDNLGYSVSINDNWALAGAPHTTSSCGSGYVFDLATGDQARELTASDALLGDRLGAAVALSGDWAVMGAEYHPTAGTYSGAAYVFDVTTGGQAPLVAEDIHPGQFFGHSVAISGSTAIVGSPQDDRIVDSGGAAYLFDITTGDQLRKLTADDAMKEDFFGYSVAISGNTALVGAYGDDERSYWVAGRNIGSAYLFNATTGEQLSKLEADDPGLTDCFGWSAAISGNRALIGAYRDTEGGTESGAAYIFDVTTGEQLAKLMPDDAEDYAWFGNAVAIDHTLAVVGAPYSNNAAVHSNAGAVYVFDVRTGEQLAKLTASDGEAYDRYGYSVAISGKKVLVGSYSHDEALTNVGAVYCYTLPEPASLILLVVGGAALALVRRGR